VLPNVELLSEDEFGLRTKRHFLEDVIYELSERISEGSPNYVQQAQGRGLTFNHNPIPAMNDIYSTLGCSDYLKASRMVNLEEQEHEHPHYAGLGAVNDFTDDLVAFAYDRQRDCDPANRPYYLECLQGIANGRQSAELQEKSVIAISMGENTLTEIDNAYKFFAIHPDTQDGDDYIIGVYQSRIEAAPLQKEEARQCLVIIGQARKSKRILSVANDKAMSVQEALDYLNVGHDTPSDSIEAVAITMVSS
jgi:ubiquitin carboxyl-terminal hydrolase 25